MAETAFEEWAVLELMGHRKLAGLVSEATIAGGAFIRIDVPGASGPEATQFYAPQAVYCITPVSEELARRVALTTAPRPVTRWDLPREVPGRLVDSDEGDEIGDGLDDDEEPE